jgi:hypothetical protein
MLPNRDTQWPSHHDLEKGGLNPLDSGFRRYDIKVRIIFWLGVLFVVSNSALQSDAAENRQAMEAAMFSDSAENSSTVDAPLPMAIPTEEPKSIGFSGQITSAFIEQVSNTISAYPLYTFTVGDIYMDARLAQQAKVFLSLEATYLSQTQITDVALKELFFDFNVDHAVYFRTGKQVLQWGRCYLWNPTDLINIERVTFIRKIGEREGAYGLKTHIPFGTSMNIYSFLSTGLVNDIQDVAGSFKVEYLLGNFEMALSAWGKRGYLPVWGYDFSTRIFGIDTVGEVTISRGDPVKRAILQGDVLTVGRLEGEWYPKASLDFSRSFTPGNFKDQLTVMVEGYYDRAGYTQHVFADPTQYMYATPVFNGNTITSQGTAKDFILGNNLYHQNYFAEGYVAMFITWNRFLVTDMILNLNYIQNINDACGILSTGVTYTTLHSLALGALLNYNVGPADREYTFRGEKYNLQLTVGIAF